MDCIKKFEGWHTKKDFPYVGYGHRLIKGETFNSNISESFADSLLRKDLRNKCSHFRKFGKDAIILGTLAYQVGEGKLLGNGKYPKSKLIKKLENGSRDIYKEYISFCTYRGKIIPSIKQRRMEEFNLLFND